MQNITDSAYLEKLENGNIFLGELPRLVNSNIVFSGKNNTLYCEKGVTLAGTSIHFSGDNATVYLSESKCPYKLVLTTNNSTVFYMGRNNYINQKMLIVLSEHKHCFIGDDGIFSSGICIRNADPHLIYDCATKKRINNSKSIYLGDHIWIGQDCLLLKGTQIESGSIIGARAVVAGKKIHHNESWAGNPCKQICKDIFWEGASVHSWSEAITDLSQEYPNFMHNMAVNDENQWVYEYNEQEYIAFNEIEKKFLELNNSQHIAEYLKELKKDKNRFVSIG